MTSTTSRVVKVGGAQLDDPAHLAALSALLHSERCPTVLVHGGGKEIGALPARGRRRAGAHLEPLSHRGADSPRR